jgi:hypothetical protein
MGYTEHSRSVGVPPPQMQAGSGFPLQVRTRRSSSLAGFPLVLVYGSMRWVVIRSSSLPWGVLVAEHSTDQCTKYKTSRPQTCADDATGNGTTQLVVPTLPIHLRSGIGRSALPVPAPCRPGASCALRPVARDTCWEEVVAMVRATLCLRLRVVHLPGPTPSILGVVHEGQFLVTDVAVPVRAVVDAVESFVSVCHGFSL